MNDDPLTYAALGMAVLGASGWLFLALIKRSVKRSDNEGTLDDRVIKMLASTEAAYNRIIAVHEETVAALRVRLEKSQDELSAAYGRIAEMQQQHHNTLTETVGRVRQENIESTRRLHDRLDTAERNHRECEKTLAHQGTEIGILREVVTKQVSPVSLSVGPGIHLSSPPIPSPA